MKNTLWHYGKHLSPGLPSRTVVVLQDRFPASQQRAYKLVCQNHNIQGRPELLANIEEQKLKRRIRLYD